MDEDDKVEAAKTVALLEEMRDELEPAKPLTWAQWQFDGDSVDDEVILTIDPRKGYTGKSPMRGAPVRPPVTITREQVEAVITIKMLEEMRETEFTQAIRGIGEQAARHWDTVTRNKLFRSAQLPIHIDTEEEKCPKK